MQRIKVRGSTRMKQNGKCSLTLWMTDAEKASLKKLAERSGRPLATLAREVLLAVAHQLNRENDSFLLRSFKVSQGGY